jgi:hypothetical protein
MKVVGYRKIYSVDIVTLQQIIIFLVAVSVSNAILVGEFVPFSNIAGNQRG